MRLRALTQTPADLLAEPKAPDEMRYAELGRYIDGAQALRERRQQADRGAGAQARAPGHLLHHRAVRRAARGQAPRAGAAVGIAISLGTTVIFLL